MARTKHTCMTVTGCLSNSFHQHRLSNPEFHPLIGGTKLIQTQVNAAQQVI